MSYDVLTPSAARLWSYGPDWRSGFNVRRSFLTDVFVSRDNTEQRRALRRSPRFSVEYRTTVTADERREADQQLRASQWRPALVPDYARWARLTGSSSGGTSTLTVSPLPAWAAAGQALLLCGDTIEQVVVDSAAGSTITLADPLADAWSSGSVLRPTFFGLLDGRISSSRLTRGAAEISVALEAYPGSEPPRAAGTAWATLGSREVFTLDPDYSSPPSVTAIWPVEQVDVDRGRTAQFRPIDRSERLAEAEFKGLSVTVATELEQFFDRMRGRRGAFYLPTCEKDFVLAASAGSGSTTFLAAGAQLATDFSAVDYSQNEMGVAIALTNGARIYRRISDIALSSGNTLVTLSAALGTAISSTNVARISWMPVCRFASDEMTTSWVTPLHASSRLSFQSVRR